MTALLLRLSPYLIAAVLVFSGGWYAGGLQPKAALARLQATDAQTRAVEESAALKAVQAQLVEARTVAQNNAQAVEALNAQNAQIAADRDRNVELARRLLVSANRPAPSSDPVPKAADHASPIAASPAPAMGSAADLLAGVAAECSANAAQLNALISEVKGQL